MKWWQKQHRIIQTNLQVKDTARIAPEKLAAQLADLGADALVFNVGGIYGWYRSAVPYHHVNEYLPEGRDLLIEVIDACHARGIRFIGRFDFTRAEDATYQAHPEWFALDASGKPMTTGAMRPGEWSLLYNTCHNSAYYNSAVAAPVLTEALSRYPIDAVFFNGIYTTRCHCDVCKTKYRAFYGGELPDGDDEADPSWRSRQTVEIMRNFRGGVEAGRPGTPLIMYHWPEMGEYTGAPLAETVCDESQNVLSRGLDGLSDDWTPSLKMKLLKLDTDAPPYGIIHSSPGMDWRHTSLPPAEYRFWLSQVPAGGGVLWHSLTGVPDTITDTRLLNCVKAVNADIDAMLPAMEGAAPVEDILLLYDRKNPPKGWLRALYERQTLFGIASPKSAPHDIFDYGAVLLPEGFPVSAELADAFDKYINSGGRLIVEGDHPELATLRGAASGQKRGEYMYSSYLSPDAEWTDIERVGIGGAPLLPFRGIVSYVHLINGARRLASLVPTFAPPDAAGAPPERASILTRHTDIPLIFERAIDGIGSDARTCAAAGNAAAGNTTAGNAAVVSLSFSLDHLIAKFALGEHLRLAEALFNRIIPSASLNIQPHYPGLIVTMFKSDKGLALHLINGVGKRPLSECIPLRGVRISVASPAKTTPATELLSGKNVRLVKSMQRGIEIPFDENDGVVSFTADIPGAWETFWIQTEDN